MKPKASTPRVDLTRGPGRPKAADPLTPVTTYLPTRTHDQLIRIANAKETDVSAVMRQIIILNVVNIFPGKPR